jgi:hypothetical protein
MHGIRTMLDASFISGFVSCENKRAVILIPKLDVAGSIPVARSKIQETNLLDSNVCTLAVD